VAGAALTVAAVTRAIGLSPRECFVPSRDDAREVVRRLRRR